MTSPPFKSGSCTIRVHGREPSWMSTTSKSVQPCSEGLDTLPVIQVVPAGDVVVSSATVLPGSTRCNNRRRGGPRRNPSRTRGQHRCRRDIRTRTRSIGSAPAYASAQWAGGMSDDPAPGGGPRQDALGLG